MLDLKVQYENNDSGPFEIFYIQNQLIFLSHFISNNPQSSIFYCFPIKYYEICLNFVKKREKKEKRNTNTNASILLSLLLSLSSCLSVSVSVFLCVSLSLCLSVSLSVSLSLLLSYFFLVVFRDRFSVCSPSCPGIHSVDHAGLVLRNLPTSAFQMLGLQACDTSAWLNIT